MILEKVGKEMITKERRVIRHRMSYLLLAIIVLTIFILQELGETLPALDLVFAIVIISAVYVAGSERNWLIAAILLAIPTLILSVISDLDTWPADNLAIIYLVFLCLFVGFAAMAVIREILLADAITVHTISAALVVYLLIGLLWALLFFIAEVKNPGSYNITEDLSYYQDKSENIFSDLTYFSLITITSTGYGDITPTGELSRTLASLEAVLGQVFLAVLVAWLVGKYLTPPSDHQ